MSPLPLPEALLAFLRAHPQAPVITRLLEPGIEFQLTLDGGPVRIPTDRNGDPKFGGQLERPEHLASRLEVVGSTGWNYLTQTSLFAIYDYDSTDHAAGHSDEALAAVLSAARRLGYVWARRSKGGAGLHVIVPLNLPARTGKQHQTNAAAMLARMSEDAGFNFAEHCDCGGVVGYFWAKRRSPNAFEVLVEPVKEAPTITVEHEEEHEAPHDAKLNEQHLRDIETMSKAGFIASWDGKTLHCHTKGIELLYLDKRRPGKYATKSRGTKPQKANCFAYPCDDGGWALSRFGVLPEAEAPGWIANAMGFAGFRVLPPFDLDFPELEADERPKKNPAKMLLDIAMQFELAHTSEHIPIIIVDEGGQRRTYLLPDRAFEAMLAKRLYDRTGIIAKSDWIRNAMRLVEAACLEGPMRRVFTRLGHHEGDIYFDLGDSTQRAVRITAEGWSITRDIPILFHRSANVSPMPEPVRGGSLEELRPLLNVADEDWPTVVAFLLASLNPRGPFPLLVLLGQSGSAKTTAARLIRGLLDSMIDEKNQREDVLAPPSKAEELLVIALHSWLLVLDNMGALSEQLSDAFCRLLTGGAHVARKLYTNSSMARMCALNPAVVTAVNDPIKAEDLRSRCLFLTLAAIDSDKLLGEQELAEQYVDARPRLMGALFDAVACALKNFRTTRPLPGNRLADATRWILAAEPATGLAPGQLAKALSENRKNAAEDALDSPLASAVRKIAAGGGARLQPEELRVELMSKHGVAIESAESLGRQLRKLATEMAVLGVHVKKEKRHWLIR